MKITQDIVDAAILRMQVAYTGLSITRALTLSARPIISGRQAGAWLDVGRDLAARGLTSDNDDLTEEQRLCLRIFEADGRVSGEAMMKAGQAKRRILESEDPKMAGPQVNLIKHIDQALAPELFTPRQVVRHEVAGSQFTLSQDDIDVLSRDEVEELERLVRVRADAADAILALVKQAKTRQTAAPELH